MTQSHTSLDADSGLTQPSKPTVGLGSDHLGVDLKAILYDHLTDLGYAVTDFGCQVGDEIDYPDIAVVVARAVVEGRTDRAILVCGTGIGMAISANKVPGIRAASVTDVYSAERASASNAAQILCLGSMVVGPGLANALADRWLESSFAGGRSERKVAKINALDRVPVTGAGQ